MNLVGRIKNLEAVLAPPLFEPYGDVTVSAGDDPEPAILAKYGDDRPKRMIINTLVYPPHYPNDTRCSCRECKS